MKVITILIIELLHLITTLTNNLIFASASTINNNCVWNNDETIPPPSNRDETTFNNWEAFIDHRPDFLIEDLEIFSDYYVIAERNMGLYFSSTLP